MRFAILLLVALIGPAAAAQQNGYAVIVNEADGVTSLSADEVSRIFFKKTHRWTNGLDVVPVDLPEDAPAREAFSAAVHGKSVGAIRAYWLQQVFSGRSAPPIQKASDEQVVDFVRDTPGAIGYVSATATLSGGVRRLQIVH